MFFHFTSTSDYQHITIVKKYAWNWIQKQHKPLIFQGGYMPNIKLQQVFFTSVISNAGNEFLAS
jgi:hypothetical protein